MSNSALTLESVQANFSLWRSQRLNNGRITPDTLRQQALELCKQFPKAQVVKALGLNYSAIKEWEQSLSEEELEPIHFVTLERPESNPKVSSKITAAHINQVTLRSAQGMQLEMNGLTTEQLCAVVSTLSQLVEASV